MTLLIRKAHPDSQKPEAVSMGSYANSLEQTILQLKKVSRASLAEINQLDAYYVQLAGENALLRKLLEAQGTASQERSIQGSVKHSDSKHRGGLDSVKSSH